MAQTNIRKHAFWLYGVIVGLAIKEAITGTLPHFYKAIPNWYQMGLQIPELSRLVIFLSLSIRFYLGATYYFEGIYEGPSDVRSEATKFDKKSYGMDFVFGMLHFLFFSALAISVNYQGDGTTATEISPYIFPVLLLLVLLYDIPWSFFNRKNDTFGMIREWRILNIFTVVISFITFGFVATVYRWFSWEFNYFMAEWFALIPVLIISFVDIAELLTGDRKFEKVIDKIIAWLQNLRPNKRP